MSASKVAEAGNTLYLRTEKPCIINNKTGEQTSLRREGNVFVMDVFVQSDSTKSRTNNNNKKNEPIPMEVNNLKQDQWRRLGFARQVTR